MRDLGRVDFLVDRLLLLLLDGLGCDIAILSDRLEVLLGRLRDFFGGAELFLCDFESRLRLIGGLFFTAHGADVDLPAGETRCEADVLATAADSERLLVVGNLSDRAILVLMEFDREDLGRLERLLHEVGSILGPFDDIDLLTAELGSDDCDTYAALADECADRVDVLIR
jgi:hypothetical protein